MEEVMIGNRRLKMIDGKICVRSHRNGVETKNGKWNQIKFRDSDGYNRCSFTIDGRKTDLYEHRLVWKLANAEWDIFDSCQDNMIDHYNRNRRDNRLENLHVVNCQQNNWNTDAKGYYFHEATGKYMAYININGKKKYLGLYSTEDEARNAYLEAKKKYHPIV